MVRGRVAEDEAVPKAVARTLAMLAMNRKGSVRVKITKKLSVSEILVKFLAFLSLKVIFLIILYFLLYRT